MSIIERRLYFSKAIFRDIWLINKYKKIQSIPLELSILRVLQESKNDNTPEKTEVFLEGVEFVLLDYKILFDRYKDLDNVVFIVDPPYLSTDVKSYKAGRHWKLSDYLNIIRTIENRPYFYFTSNKSQIVELFNWLHNNNYGCSPFANATVKLTTNRVNSSSGYEDSMIYKLTA
ncbi:hypothetical protein [Chryseobacterium joostei]|uniref:hypothetical protein n=1 Tax=Chryseobacterium joostei TaxID=112234 RepID=UPI003D0BCAEA